MRVAREAKADLALPPAICERRAAGDREEKDGGEWTSVAVRRRERVSDGARVGRCERQREHIVAGRHRAGLGAKRAPRPRARPSEGPTDVRFADTIGSPESGRKFPTGSVARAPLALAGTRTRIGNRGGRHRGRHGGRLHLRLGSLARDRGCRSLCNGPSRSRHAPDLQLRVDVGVSRGSTNQIARRPEIQIHEPESNARDSRIDELTRPEHP